MTPMGFICWLSPTLFLLPLNVLRVSYYPVFRFDEARERERVRESPSLHSPSWRKPTPPWAFAASRWTSGRPTSGQPPSRPIPAAPKAPSAARATSIAAMGTMGSGGWGFATRRGQSLHGAGQMSIFSLERALNQINIRVG